MARRFTKGGDPVAHFEEMWAIIKDIPLGYKKRESWEELRTSGTALLAKFVAEELPVLGTISTVEKRFEFSVTLLDQPFVGVIDLIAERNRKRTVVDFKTAGAS